MKIRLFLFALAISVFQINAQNPQEKWTFGLHAGAVLYSEADAQIVNGAYIDVLPRVTLSRYMFKNITFQAAIGFSTLDAQKYTSFDGIARYDFGQSYENVVPYVLLGGSFINAATTTPTLNFGAGSTFWVHPNIGINAQVMYKFSESRFESQRSHIYPTLGLVYSFKARNMNPRLWHFKH